MANNEDASTYFNMLCSKLHYRRSLNDFVQLLQGSFYPDGSSLIEKFEKYTLRKFLNDWKLDKLTSIFSENGEIILHFNEALALIQGDINVIKEYQIEADGAAVLSKTLNCLRRGD